MKKKTDSPRAGVAAAATCSETEIALLRAMRRNRGLIDEYQRWPATVQMLKQEIAAAAEAFADNDEERMNRLTCRMNANLPAVGSQNNIYSHDPQNGYSADQP